MTSNFTSRAVSVAAGIFAWLGAARVAMAATAIGALDELAGALCLGTNTAKTHLQHIDAKTGVNGRAERLRVMWGLASVG